MEGRVGRQEIDMFLSGNPQPMLIPLSFNIPPIIRPHGGTLKRFLQIILATIQGAILIVRQGVRYQLRMEGSLRVLSG